MEWGRRALDVYGVTGLLVTLVAATACALWAERSRHPQPFHRRDALALSGWVGMSAVGRLLAPLHDAAGGSLLAAFGWVISGAAMALAIAGVAGVARRVLPPGRVLAAALDSALIGIGLATVVWSITGAGRDGLSVLRPLTTAVVSAGILTLVLRARDVDPSLVVDGRFRGALGWGVTAAGAMTISGWCGVLGGTGAATAGSLAALAGYLAMAWAALAGPRPPHPAGRARFVERRAALVVAAMAILALVLRASMTGVGGIGTAGALLAVVLPASLLAVLVLASRENDRLGADLEHSRAQVAAMAATSSDVVIALDGDGRVLAANEAARTLLVRPPEDLVGHDVTAVVADDDRMRLHAAVLDVVQGLRETARLDLVLAPPAIGTAELRLRGIPGGAVATLCDVTESVELRQRLASVTRFDEMTGLANRQHLVEELGGWLSGGQAAAVLCLDLDGFKAVNDRFGHTAGDAVLVEVTSRLVASAERMTGTAMVGRLGSDEFVIALRDVSGPEAVRAADDVLLALRPTFAVDDLAVRIGASIGVAATDDDGPGTAAAGGAQGPDGPPPGEVDPRTAAKTLLHRADIAMFAAKESGRAQVMSWDADLQAQARRRVDIAIGLRRALETGRMALAYQPIVRLADGVIVSVEALIRLPGRDDDREGAEPGSLAGLADLVAPAELVEVAEGTGEIDELGRWVLKEATRQAALWQRLGHRARVSVNMSVRQLSDPDFDEVVLGALTEAGLPADRLIIEITEGQLLGEDHLANQTLEKLRSRGVQLAIDDFGSGYSSLSYLRRMPVRAVKIDRTLLGGIGTDDRATTLVRAVIGAARGMGLQVICEGIESLAVARLLRELGAWAGQGFALHAALDPTALLDVLDGPPVTLADPPSRHRAPISHVETRRSVD